jgi:hypothetical protein
MRRTLVAAFLALSLLSIGVAAGQSAWDRPSPPSIPMVCWSGDGPAQVKASLVMPQNGGLRVEYQGIESHWTLPCIAWVPLAAVPVLQTPTSVECWYDHTGEKIYQGLALKHGFTDDVLWWYMEGKEAGSYFLVYSTAECVIGRTSAGPPL